MIDSRVDPAPAGQGTRANARLGMILFVAAEAMLFGTLMAGFVVLRFGSGHFAGMERPPAGAAALATCFLAAGSAALAIARRGEGRGRIGQLRGGVLGALALGILFLALQTLEWQRLIAGGLAPRSNIYGGMLYALSWTHAAHVAGGIILLGVVALRSFRNDFAAGGGSLLSAVSIYWHFLTLVWLVLFTFLFLV